MSDETNKAQDRTREAAGDLAGDELGVGEPVSDSRERARKIEPRYVAGDLVRVAGATNQAEAELVQGLLLEEGIPSMLRRTRGFDVADMLAAGPRDIMVPQAGHAAAREVLLQAEIVRDEPTRVPPPARLPGRVLAALLKAMRIYRPSGSGGR